MVLVYMHGKGILLFIYLFFKIQVTLTDGLVYLISAAYCYAQSLSEYLPFSVDVL